MIRLLVAGATGQTGGASLEAARSDDRFELVGGISSSKKEVAGCPMSRTGADAPDADVLIDFTLPGASVALIRDAAKRGMAVVTGTTGLSDEQEAEIRKAAESVPIVRSGNFSLGVNMLLALVEEAAAKLDGYDIEIAETHHRRKVDAPSGTALMLGEAAARGAGVTLSERGVFDRHGQTGPRKEGEIGFSVQRGGGIKGDHTVSFFGENDVISLSHRALDRRLFAEGALRAALWVNGKAPGIYTMRDVLGLD